MLRTSEASRTSALRFLPSFLSALRTEAVVRDEPTGSFSVSPFYEAKVPMNRGCLPLDVARAVMYCVEQQYETGQAIPVTGGQVMLA